MESRNGKREMEKLYSIMEINVREHLSHLDMVSSRRETFYISSAGEWRTAGD
jgi:hypothetical protein